MRARSKILQHPTWWQAGRNVNRSIRLGLSHISAVLERRDEGGCGGLVRTRLDCRGEHAMNSSEGVFGAHEPDVLLAGPDTLHFSADISISDAVRAKLDDEKELAQSAEMAKTAHCPDWPGAQIHPHGSRWLRVSARGRRLLGQGARQGHPSSAGALCRTALPLPFLHTHRGGPRGACEEALCWLREQLL